MTVFQREELSLSQKATRHFWYVSFQKKKRVEGEITKRVLKAWKLDTVQQQVSFQMIRFLVTSLLTQYIDASMQGSDSQSAAPVPHRGSKAPCVSFHIVALYCVQLVGAIISAHHKNVIAQSAHTYEINMVQRREIHLDTAAILQGWQDSMLLKLR